MNEEDKIFISEYIIGRYNDFKNVLNNNFEDLKKHNTNYIKERLKDIEREQEIKFTSQNSSLTSLQKQLEQKIDNFVKLKTTELNNVQNEIKSECINASNNHERKLMDSIQAFENQFDANELNRKNKFDAINKQIIGLLPQAAAIGISKSYEEIKKFYISTIVWYRYAYIASIAIMLIIPFAAYYWGLLPQFFSEQISAEQFIFSALRLAAIELPVFILVRFFNIKINQHLRMLSEYFHKYTSAMTFVGMSKEAKENTKLFGEDHIKKLTEGFRDMVYYNPSDNLDKININKDPFDILSQIIDKFGADGAKSIIDQIKPSKK